MDLDRSSNDGYMLQRITYAFAVVIMNYYWGGVGATRHPTSTSLPLSLVMSSNTTTTKSHIRPRGGQGVQTLILRTLYCLPGPIALLPNTVVCVLYGYQL